MSLIDKLGNVSSQLTNRINCVTCELGKIKTHRVIKQFPVYMGTTTKSIEKAPKSKFYAPIVYALPKTEFALCVDDDMGILGYSGIARGVSNVKRTKRGITHYSKLSPKFWLSKIGSVNPNLNPIDQNLPESSIERVLRGILNVTNIFTNTLEFVVFEVIDLVRKGLKN